MTQEFPNQTSSPLWTSESVRLEKLAWRQELGRRAIARSRMNRVCLMLLIWLALFSQLSSTGGGRLAAACGTVGLVLIWKRRPFWQNVMFARSGRPRAGEVLLWVLCLLALQGAAGLLQSLLSPAMEFFRTKSKVVSGTAETTVSLALYTAVAAPITEELLFRGAVLRSLQPYGKRFAIFCSALLFGLVHQNLTQTPFAFGFGLLAGYVAMEYSILWSMSLHILNNAVLALGLDALLRPLSGTWYWLAIRGVLFLLPLAVCLVLALLPAEKEFVTDDGLTGILSLDLSTVRVEVAGYGSSTKEVSATRSYPNLAGQDTQYIPKTIEEDGRTLTLQTVNWQTDNTANMDGYAVGDRFTAVATYTGTATSSYVKGYTVTADYTGTVSRIALNKVRYVAIFEGTPLEPIVPTEDESTGPAQFNWLAIAVPFGIVALVGAGTGAALFMKRRHETTEEESE